MKEPHINYMSYDWDRNDIKHKNRDENSELKKKQRLWEDRSELQPL
jgi:hypothetical protein